MSQHQEPRLAEVVKVDGALFVENLGAVGGAPSLCVANLPWPLAMRGLPIVVHTILPWPGASDQKSTPSTPLIFCLSSRPSGMTSP